MPRRRPIDPPGEPVVTEPGAVVHWLLRLVERFGWQNATMLMLVGVVAAAIGTTLVLHLLLIGPMSELWIGGLVLAALVAIIVALPGLGVTLRLVDHLAATQERLRREVTRRSRAEIRLRKMVTEDQLTGIPNRRSLLTRARTAIGMARRYHQPLSLMLIDLDHFKQVNDEHGHQAGDRALVRLAGILTRHVREVDLPARIGGDEFVVLLPQTGAEDAVCAAERIRAAVAEDEEAPRITVTIGVSEADVEGGQSFADLLRAADDALYAAKRAGRNCVRRWPGWIEAEPQPLLAG